jgi:hypothetical protein
MKIGNLRMNRGPIPIATTAMEQGGIPQTRGQARKDFRATAKSNSVNSLYVL